MRERSRTYNARSSLKLIGTMRSKIVGTQYYETTKKVDDVIYFERNPYNDYDPNAIEVSNKNGILGHLNRKQAAWIGPMIDEGRIYLKGQILDEGDNWRLPIAIEVYLTNKGEKIMIPGRPDSAKQVIHNHLLDLFNKAADYSTETLIGVRDYYNKLIHSDGIMPETYLIFKLLQNKTAKNRKNDLKIFVDNARHYFDTLKYVKVIQHEGITVVPLIVDDAKMSRYMSGKEALKTNSLIIQEIGEGGQVSRLRATNRGNKPVMLISGEGLKGAKQDRIVNVTVIIEVNETVEVPVSCVERGRWSYNKQGNNFKSANFAAHAIRKSVREDVNSGIAEGKKTYDSDQDMVWHGVSKMAAEYSIESPTDNLNEVYKGKKTEIDQIVKKIKYVKSCVGIAIFANDKQMSLDLFQSPELMKNNWNDIIRSIAIDIERVTNKSKKSPTIPAMRKKIKTFFDNICSDAIEPEESPGAGHYIVSRNENMEAGTLYIDNTIAHISGIYND